MSDFNHGLNNQGNRGEGSGMDSRMEQNYRQRQSEQQYPQMTPEQQFIGNLASDPAMAAQLAREMQARLAGTQQQQPAQPPVNPFQAIEDDINRLQGEVNALSQVPVEQRDWGGLAEKDRQLLARRQDLVEARQNYSLKQQADRERINEARNTFSQFLVAVVGSMPDDFVASLNTDKRTLSDEFKNYVTSRYNQNELSAPGTLNRILPDLWKAFAFERNIPAPGQYNQYAPQQGLRQGEQYNQYAPQQYAPQQYAPQQGQYQPQQQPPQAQGQDDKLANVFSDPNGGPGMSDHERALMKNYYYEKGDYDTANRIVYRDGSPIPKRGDF